jgi:hypothetical protein
LEFQINRQRKILEFKSFKFWFFKFSLVEAFKSVTMCSKLNLNFKGKNEKRKKKPIYYLKLSVATFDGVMFWQLGWNEIQWKLQMQSLI